MAALTRLRRGAAPHQVENEAAEIVNTLEEARVANGLQEVCAARRALVAGLGIVALQQLTGQPSVLYYQKTVFELAGFRDLASSASVIIGAAKLLATLVAVSFVDRFGRRPLLFAGIGMMLAALLTLACGFGLGTQAGDGTLVLAPGWPAIVVLALVVYVCGYQIGFGPIAWLMISEVFPLKTRTQALSLAVLLNFGTNLVMTFALKHIQGCFDALLPGRGGALLFALYAAFCALSLLFVYAAVPETKGKSLEEIESMLRPTPLL